MKISLARRRAPSRKQSQSYGSLPMSVHAASLLLEAIFLKSKSLEALGRYKEAAQSCSIILDVIESSSPGGLPENFAGDCKLQETLSKAVELLPELWKLADSPSETILSYRRSLLHPWNLDAQTLAGIQKEFAIYLLYSGGEANPPNLRIQMDSSFVPKNNIEEAILLLMILLREATLKRIEWDPSVLDHLSYALCISGGFIPLANQMEELLPGTMERKDRFEKLALCYYGEGDDLAALNLLRKLLSRAVDPAYVPALLLASKICGENSSYAVDGINFAQQAIENLHGKCDQLTGVAKFLLGVSLATCSRSATADSERAQRQTEALQSLEAAGKITGMNDPMIVYHLCLEHAEQRKLDASLYYAKCLLKLDSGSNIRGWLLLARILSAQKRFEDAETIISAALDQTGKWDQGELLRTKAKLQIAQGHLKDAIETFTKLLAVLQVQLKSFGSGKKLKNGRKPNRSLELETWHDLAVLYITLNQWRDAEICLSKSEAISCYSAMRLHTAGLLHEAKGLHKEALRDFEHALSVDPTHVPSLVSMAVVLRQIGTRSAATVRSFLTEAIRLDRMNASAWYNLGLVCKDEGPGSAREAGDCFQAAASLEETEPVEPFR
ncbi:OLC1v1006972C2 [Oldenlandia corymbosa var. corymbosa]|nr:OLC1v1006972C2 [Oldenlandia corymbosa var. corymbosa]